MWKGILQRISIFSRYNEGIGRCVFSTSSVVYESKISCKVAIIGGGTGGLTMASQLLSKIGGSNIVLVEPSEVHFYQPYWTLVGAGIKELKDSYRSMAAVLPKDVKWLKDCTVFINAAENTVETEKGTKIQYDFLIVAIGLKLAFEKIKGLPFAFETPGVCSNYSFHTVPKTLLALKNFQKGNAVFTQPINPIKCAGAPQKITYLAEDYLRKEGKRDEANVLFCTALGKLFSVPKYEKALSRVAEKKEITVKYHHNLIEVKPHCKEAIFQKGTGLESPYEIEIVPYEMLHVTPPMIAPSLIETSSLADSSGFLDIDMYTLQHKAYENIFGIGDCTNLPTSKTAAAIAAQCGVLTKNMLAAMNGKRLIAEYNGYSSCPLVTGNKKGIIAEFDYDLQPLETLPFDQSKESYLQYYCKKEFIPFIYWNMLLKGRWRGPGTLRKILHLGMAR